MHSKQTKDFATENTEGTEKKEQGFGILRVLRGLGGDKSSATILGNAPTHSRFRLAAPLRAVAECGHSRSRSIRPTFTKSHFAGEAPIDYAQRLARDKARPCSRVILSALCWELIQSSLSTNICWKSPPTPKTRRACCACFRADAPGHHRSLPAGRQFRTHRSRSHAGRIRQNVRGRDRRIRRQRRAHGQSRSVRDSRHGFALGRANRGRLLQRRGASGGAGVSDAEGNSAAFYRKFVGSCHPERTEGPAFCARAGSRSLQGRKAGLAD